jgi:hypothetical protein
VATLHANTDFGAIIEAGTQIHIKALTLYISDSPGLSVVGAEVYNHNTRSAKKIYIDRHILRKHDRTPLDLGVGVTNRNCTNTF